MAEHQQLACKFFAQGYCRAGNTCKFRHDTVGIKALPKPQSIPIVCKYFLDGYCRMGRQCPYRHELPAKDPHAEVTLKDPPKSRGETREMVSVTASQSVLATVPVEMPSIGVKAPRDASDGIDGLVLVDDGKDDDGVYFYGAAGTAPTSFTSKSKADSGAMRSTAGSGQRIDTSTRGYPATYLSMARHTAGVDEVPQPQANLGDRTSAAITCSSIDTASGVGAAVQPVAVPLPHPLRPPRSASVAAAPAPAAALTPTPATSRVTTNYAKQHTQGYIAAKGAPPPPPLPPTLLPTPQNPKQQQEYECGICLESTVAKRRRFGLLTGCAHHFCLPCIRQWRGQGREDKALGRLCPVCRQPSYFILPSNRYVPDGAEKEQLINRYIANMSRIPCKLFDEGRGSCPHGNSCFYLHAYPDGTIAKAEVPRFAQGADGTSTVVSRPGALADWIRSST